mgnify:CR=1 FL=1
MGWNRSHYYGEFNSSKLSLALALKQAAALSVGEGLIPIKVKLTIKGDTVYYLSLIHISAPTSPRQS